MFVWLWLVVNDRKFPAETVFFSHTNQPTVLLHEPATKRTSQPNRLKNILIQIINAQDTREKSIKQVELIVNNTKNGTGAFHRSNNVTNHLNQHNIVSFALPFLFFNPNSTEQKVSSSLKHIGQDD